MVEPVLISIASSIAAKAAGGVYDLVRQKFAKTRETTAVLDEAAGAPEDSTEVLNLAKALERAEQTDTEFGTRLRAEWAKLAIDGRVGDGSLTNDVSGSVSGNVVQARDIQGNITF
ncbi:hypothetical protein K7711_46070 [Nocardia sp. CA2R105]|uniref:hypothetical protein n=1 Tax=Nocardia coffeae TaxID=2873381 RepID=UPI001CA7624D|nr:hypothetical protein [Nocardia coffeae]MBY8863899.1 hypothetical protein [Nocardia coffeae]